jgi:hypothetical protein
VVVSRHQPPSYAAVTTQNVLKPVQAAVVLPPQRPVFLPVPQKPPGDLKKHECVLSIMGSDTDGFTFGTTPKSFLPRPLASLSFCDRSSQHSAVCQTLPSSLLLQIDGLLFATFRERLERDVCATSASDSVCPFWGPSLSPASTYCGLYFPTPALLADVIAACRSERGLGVFIGRIDSVSIITLLADNLVLLRFDFPHTAFSEWCGVFCSFTFAGRVKRRKDHIAFDIPILLDGCVPKKIGLLPFCPARMSPTPFLPQLVDDICNASPSFAPYHDIPLPEQVASWDSATIAQCATTYPFKDIAELCIAAASPEGSDSCFAGDRQKCVLAKNSPLSPLQWENIREKFLDDISLKRMLGPFPRCPFPNDWCNAQARQISLSTRPKDKWDPLSERFRVISSLSVHKPSSVNDLVFSPKLVSFHLQGTNLRDSLASFGPRAAFNTIDHVEAFRSNRVNLRDTHLYVYCVPHGTENEWFVDLTACFGGVVSEWSYAVEVAIIKWHLQNDCLITGPSFDSASMQGYVDNWFLIGNRDDASFPSRWERVKSFFAKLGICMHEEQLSSAGVVNAVGWDWDTANHSFACPSDKLGAARALITEWSSRASSGGIFSFSEIEKLVGLYRWISTACPIVLPAVAHLQAFGYSISKSNRAVPLDARTAAAVHFLSAYFTSWDGRCPIFAGFSPAYSFEYLIRSDASTSDGCGGFCLPFTSGDCGFLACYHAWDSDERSDALGHSETPVRESTMFFELLGLLHLLEHFVVHLRGRRVQFECDSEPAIRALSKGYSKMPLCMRIISRFWLICATNLIIPRFEHILAQYNTIADALSHFRVSQAEEAALSEFGVGFTHRPYSLSSPPIQL